MSLRLRPPFVALLAFGVAVLLAGCGGTGAEPARELTSLTQVVDASSSFDTGRFELRLKQALPGTEKTIELSANGAFDTSAKRASMSFDLSGFASLLGGLGEDADWKLEAVQDGLVMFMRLPILTKQLPPGKTWVRMDLAELGEQQGFDFAQLQSIASSDPRKALEYLKAVAGQIVPLGREEVRGVETTHYKASIDLSKYADLVAPAQRDTVQGMFDTLLEQTGLSIVPADVWVDDQGLVRKVTLTLEMTPSGEGTFRTEIVVEMFDYGDSVSIDLPPADQVVDYKQLAPS